MPVYGSHSQAASCYATLRITIKPDSKGNPPTMKVNLASQAASCYATLHITTNPHSHALLLHARTLSRARYLSSESALRMTTRS